jgi:hypothetical protein
VKQLLQRLHRDEGGNVAVLAVAASLLLVAMLWAIIGTGQRVVQKETIQSSADAAAFSAAVIKAKGLNLISFCNLVMAMLMALVMLLRIIKYALVATAVSLSVLCAIPYAQWACGAASAVDNLASQFSNWEGNAERLLKQGAQGLAQTERAVAKITPVLSLVEAYHVGTDDAYKAHFGKGTLVTVAYPLPTQGLPVEDGTCNDLAKQAGQDYKMLSALVVAKIGGMTGLSKKVGEILGDAVAALLTPLEGILCGGSANVDTSRLSASCDECARKGSRSFWSGDRFVDGANAGPGECVMNGMPGWSCGGSTAGPVACDSDGAANVRFHNLRFSQCEIREQQRVDGDSDWPKPLVFTSDWDKQRQVRAFTVLTDSDVATRRRAVGIAVRTQDRSGALASAPAANQLLGMAQAEWLAWNGSDHADLFHMNWRARLVRFSFSDGSDMQGGVGDAGGQGVPAGAGDVVSGVLGSIMGGAGGALQDQFLLH